MIEKKPNAKKRPRKGTMGTAEAAKELGVSQGRVRHMIVGGRLAAKKVGGVWVIESRNLQKIRFRKPGRPRKSGG